MSLRDFHIVFISAAILVNALMVWWTLFSSFASASLHWLGYFCAGAFVGLSIYGYCFIRNPKARA